MFVKVASVAFGGAGFDFLDYKVPNNMILEIGDLVSVPFNNRQVTGYIINKVNNSQVPNPLFVTEKIQGGNRLTPDLIDLAMFVAKTYFCPLSRVILSLIPPALNNEIKTKWIIDYSKFKKDNFEKHSENTFDEYGFTPKESEILWRIENGKGLLGKLDESEKRVLRSLVKKEIIKKDFEIVRNIKPKLIKTVKLNTTCEKLTPKQNELVEYLKEKEFIPVSYLVKNKISSSSIINNLISKNILICEEVREDRIPDWTYISPSLVTLTEEQNNAYLAVKESIDKKINDTFLLFGVTASGKTEVYIKLIEYVLKQNKTAMVLLPEIALTTQVMNIFKSRFGRLVAVLHSNLSKGERLDEWDRVKNGQAKIVLGARSAIFAPLENIGIIIIDEEHDGGYKQDNLPKYHAKELAIYRAKKYNGVCVFGSATPSIESYYKATTGEYKLINMPTRVTGRKLPTVYMADLKGNKTDLLFTPLLLEKIEDRLKKHEQIILLQNRRAYSTYVMCPDCAWVAKCKNCDVSLKFHFKSNMLVCHHCGYSIPKPVECPDCHNKFLRAYGSGTQKVEEVIKSKFPTARLLRMDRDTTTTKNAHREIINAFRDHEADILVGTQMVAKGLDFPKVTLVGVINGDTDLNMPDFRSGERTFQLINQVTGRAGRGDVEGEVVIQTYNPENSILKFAQKQDYIGLFNSEIEARKSLAYPPFVRIIKVSVQGEKLSDIRQIIEKFHNDLVSVNDEKDKMIIYPPMPAVIPKINNIYKVNMLIKTYSMDYTKDKIYVLLNTNMLFKKKLIFDIDPMFMD